MNGINLTDLAITAATLRNVLLNSSPTIPHAAIYGSNEVITPGVYSTVAAASLTGQLTLDGPGLYIFIITGAVTGVAGFNMQLINGATAANVFWDITGMPTIAGSFVGTVLSPVAITVSINAVITGRLISTALTTITLSANTISIPVPSAPDPGIDLGDLSSFALFTNGGGILNSGTTVVNGDVGINSLVAPTNTGILSINGSTYSSADSVTNCKFSSGIYKNAIEILGPTREVSVNHNTSGIVSLQSFIIPISTGDTMDIRFSGDCDMTVGPQTMIIMPVL
jgi:hypothetical protein